MQNFLEITLFIEVFLNYLIIKVTGLFLREKPQYAFLSALLVGEISLLFPQIFIGIIGKIILICINSLFIVMITFKCFSVKDFARVWSVFMLTTFVFGGAMLAIQNIAGQFPTFLVLAFATVIYIISYCVIKSVQKKNRIKNFYYKVKLKDNGQEFEEEGFLDSGNMLYDNITKKPVMLISFDVFHKLYKHIPIVSVITKTIDKSSIKNGHYIKINSIGSKTSILIFSVDEVIIGEDKKFKDVMVGLSLSGFEKSFDRGVLLHSELV